MRREWGGQAVRNTLALGLVALLGGALAAEARGRGFSGRRAARPSSSFSRPSVSFSRPAAPLTRPATLSTPHRTTLRSKRTPVVVPATTAVRSSGFRSATPPRQRERLARLTIEPTLIRMTGRGAPAQVRVRARYSGGRQREVTRQARLTLVPEGIARIEGSRLIPLRNGKSQLIARLPGSSHSATAEVQVVGTTRKLGAALPGRNR